MENRLQDIAPLKAWVRHRRVDVRLAHSRINAAGGSFVSRTVSRNNLAHLRTGHRSALQGAERDERSGLVAVSCGRAPCGPRGQQSLACHSWAEAPTPLQRSPLRGGPSVAGRLLCRTLGEGRCSSFSHGCSQPHCAFLRLVRRQWVCKVVRPGGTQNKEDEGEQWDARGTRHCDAGSWQTGTETTKCSLLQVN